MDQDRETDQILMNIRQAGGGMMPLLLFSAQMEMKMLVFLMRMAKKAFISLGGVGKYKQFLERTKGEFQIVNIPFSKEQIGNIERMQELERLIEDAKSPFQAREYKKKLEELKGQLPELQQLEKLGIDHCVLPKLNGVENTLQVAVAKKDSQAFRNWFLNHLTDNLSGGTKDIRELNAFTEGNVSIFNMPFEGEELQDMLHDFDVLKVNYTVLPDLNVGDGYTQVAVANKDRGLLESWFGLWKQKQLQEGKEVREYTCIDQGQYLATSEIDTEDYISSTDRKYQEANAEFEAQSQKISVKEPLRSESSAEFLELSNNPNFEKITINRETLVDNFIPPGDAGKWEGFGFFLSRIPGTFGNRQETLLLPSDRVFRTDDERTFVAFLDKARSTKVINADGRLEARDFSSVYRRYDQVNRGFGKVDSLAKQAGEAQKTAEDVLGKTANAAMPKAKL